MDVPDSAIPSAGARAPVVHELKVWPRFFDALIDGRKTFEVRKADRDFREGDELLLREYTPTTGDVLVLGHYSGRSVRRRISFVLVDPVAHREALAEGYVILGLGRVRDDDVEWAATRAVAARFRDVYGPEGASGEAVKWDGKPEDEYSRGHIPATLLTCQVAVEAATPVIEAPLKERVELLERTGRAALRELRNYLEELPCDGQQIRIADAFAAALDGKEAAR